MAEPTTSIFLNSTTPAAPSGNQNVQPQSDGATPQQSVTFYPKKATSSLLGVVVPDGTTITVDDTGKISTTVGTAIVFGIGSGASGTNVLPFDIVATHAGSVSSCVVRVRQSDGATPLTFRIKRNGVDVFVSDPTLAAGTAVGSYSFTNLTPSPLNIAKGDVFTMDITSGTANWQFTAVLE